MRIRKYFCYQCGRVIKKKQLPWCELCNMSKYQESRKIGNNLKSKNNMLIKNQGEDAPEKEAPVDAPENGDEKKEEEEEKEKTE